jgi:hypothetical protein
VRTELGATYVAYVLASKPTGPRARSTVGPCRPARAGRVWPRFLRRRQRKELVIDLAAALAPYGSE